MIPSPVAAAAAAITAAPAVITATAAEILLAEYNFDYLFQNGKAEVLRMRSHASGQMCMTRVCICYLHRQQ
jgi:hypothetical protein